MCGECSRSKSPEEASLVSKEGGRRTVLMVTSEGDAPGGSRTQETPSCPLGEQKAHVYDKPCYRQRRQKCDNSAMHRIEERVRKWEPPIELPRNLDIPYLVRDDEGGLRLVLIDSTDNYHAFQ